MVDLDSLPLCFLPLLAVAEFDLFPDPKAGSWLIVTLVLLSGIITAGMGFYLNRGPGSWAIDPATGLKYFDKSSRHSLYFIPMQYWGLVYCAGAALLAWFLLR